MSNVFDDGVFAKACLGIVMIQILSNETLNTYKTPSFHKRTLRLPSAVHSIVKDMLL